MTTKKIKSPEQLKRIIAARKKRKEKIAFTNGCFDILHPGHISYLEQASKKGDVFVVALNTDSSVRRIKGPLRPIMPLKDRQRVMAALECVDYITSFNEPTPLKIITMLKPNFIIKGADWKVKDIVGRDVVSAYGGKAIAIKYIKGYSTSDIINKIHWKSKKS